MCEPVVRCLWQIAFDNSGRELVRERVKLQCYDGMDVKGCAVTFVHSTCVVLLTSVLGRGSIVDSQPC